MERVKKLGSWATVEVDRMYEWTRGAADIAISEKDMEREKHV